MSDAITDLGGASPPVRVPAGTHRGSAQANLAPGVVSAAPGASFGDAATARLRSAAQAIMRADGLPDSLADAATAVIAEARTLEQCAAGLLAVLVEAEALDATAKAAQDAIRAERARLERAAEIARAALLACIEDTGMPAIEGAHHMAHAATTPASVLVQDIDALPEQFRRVKVEPDKAAISAALKAGTKVPGATLSNGGATLRITARKRDTVR